MTKYYLKLFLLLFLLVPISAIGATISVGTVVVDFNKDKKKSYIDVPVFNRSKGDEKAYVKVTVYEIKNPGKNNEEKILVPKNNRDTLIVSPQKMIIPPKGKKNVRFIFLNKDMDKDRVYRVNVAPISNESSIDKGTSKIKILIAYDILVFVRPKDEDNSFSAKRNGKKITFKNTGNTNVLLRKAKQCSKNNLSKCNNIAGKRLYAGMNYVQELPYDNKVEYTYSVGDKIHRIVYN